MLDLIGTMMQDHQQHSHMANSKTHHAADGAARLAIDNCSKKPGFYLQCNLLEKRKAAGKVHEIAYAFGLATEHGCVRTKACLKFCFGQ